MILITFVILLNLGISFWNARACGQAWDESKAIGGWLHFVTWSALVQSVIGFSMAYVAVIGGIAAGAGLLPPKAVHALFSLWYLAIIFPLLGSGIALTIQSWIVAYRERSLLSMGVAGWNTYAQVSNTMDAMGGVSEALGKVGEFFDSDDEVQATAVKLAVVALFMASIGGGALTTWTIVSRYRKTLPRPVGVRTA